MINLIKKIKGKLSCLFCRRYYIVYQDQNNKIKTYQIGNINLYNSFGNKRDKRSNVGFKAFCFARGQMRSFRHDRIISITKK
jgi:predicted DNA-binding transcriptional regulator YafY